MELVFAFFFIIFVVILTIIVFFRRSKLRVNLKKDQIPEYLGCIEGTPIQPLKIKLESALTSDLVHQVRTRFLQSNSKITEDEFEWRLFELKRFFLLTGVLKTVPMYSEEVDDVWHEMLMFTQNYQTFSEKYNGSMLHHKPNVQGGGDPSDRAFFDWVFSQLFEITQFSWQTWGDFFRHPLHPTLIKEFQLKDEHYLKEKYFRITEESEQIADYLINKFKEQCADAENIHKQNEKEIFRKQQLYGDFSNTSLIMVYYSIFYYEQYWSMAKEYLYSDAAKNSSGCTTAVFCGSAMSGSKNGDNGDSSSCSSGDASCGGGCSS